VYFDCGLKRYEVGTRRDLLRNRPNLDRALELNVGLFARQQ